MTGYILAGGKNRRMDGKKKCFLEYEGRTFYESVYEALEPYCEKIYLSVEDKEKYKETGLPVIEDQYLEIGPIGGIHAGLSAATLQSEDLFVAACDMPFFTACAAGEIVRKYQENRIVTLAAENGRIHPLCGIYPKSVLSVVESMIKEGNFRMMALLDRVSWQSVSFEKEQGYFKNINTTEEYLTL